MATSHFLKISELKTHFYTQRGVVKAVDGVSLNITRNQIVGLAGESGSGKSVFARSIMRLVQPPGRIIGGRVELEGTNLLDLKEREMRRIRGGAIAMSFQNPLSSLNPVKKIGPQIVEVFRAHAQQAGILSARYGAAKKLHSRAHEIMEAVRIPDPERTFHCYPHQLSGGMRQRIVLGIALACNPSLLIADEPTTALDVTIQASILALLKLLQEAQKISSLLITHDLALICYLCDWVAIMYA